MRGGGSYHDNSHCFHCSFVVLDHWSKECIIIYIVLCEVLKGLVPNFRNDINRWMMVVKPNKYYVHSLQDPWNVSSWSPIVGGDKLQGTQVMVAMRQCPVHSAYLLSMDNIRRLFLSAATIVSQLSYGTSSGSCPGQVDQDITCTLLPVFTPCLA